VYITIFIRDLQQVCQSLPEVLLLKMRPNCWFCFQKVTDDLISIATRSGLLCSLFLCFLFANWDGSQNIQ